MAMKKKQKKLLIISIIIVLVIVLIVIVVIKKRSNTPRSLEQIQSLEEDYKAQRNEEIKKELYGMSEQQRMQYYCASFFKLADNGEYEEAYKLLNSTYKENYFPTLKNFEMYFEENFPSKFSLTYENIERLGEIYVLKANIKDSVNGQYGHNFGLYVVLKESALNEYEISFSRNSAVEEE